MQKLSEVIFCGAMIILLVSGIVGLVYFAPTQPLVVAAGTIIWLVVVVVGAHMFYLDHIRKKGGNVDEEWW